VSGRVQALDISLVDSDTNDPFQQGRAQNNSPATAQLASNPARIVGYVNLASTGPSGANFSAGDRWDIYRVDLVAGQVVELNFGDSTRADLDLFIGDSSGAILGSATGVTKSECVRITRTATYTVGVYAFSGASAYELTWGPPVPGSSCANAAQSIESAAAFVPGELIAKPKVTKAGVSDRGALAKLREAQLVTKSAPAEGAAMLIEIPKLGLQRSRTMAALAKSATAPGQKVNAHEAPAGVSDETRLAFETIIAAKQLFAAGGFEYVELNSYQKTQQAAYLPWPPSDQFWPRMPHLGLIRLPDAFNALASFSPRPSYIPIVAVVDTGIVADHPDLQRMLVPGYDFVSDPVNAGDGGGIDADPNDASGPGSRSNFHGTHVAGTIAAESFNGQGTVGVAPMARIMPIRVLGVAGSGTAWDIVQGIRFAAGLPNDSGTLPARRADVINLSLGGQGACPSFYADVVSVARAQGAIVVAAAGNDSGAPVGRPANCPGAIAVSAVS
jgi:serine protease